MGVVTIGVDLGQRRDPTAIAVVEREWRDVGARWEAHHTARHLERLDLGTPYPAVARRVAEVIEILRRLIQAAEREALLAESDPLGPPAPEPPTLGEVYLDTTGVGQPVVDVLREAGVRVRAVYFTHGDRRTDGGDEVKLGKAWLVSRMQSLLQNGRLHLPRTAEAEVLAKELLDYEIKVDQNANDTYGAFKVGTHDDLVTALGLATQEDGQDPDAVVRLSRALRALNDPAVWNGWSSSDGDADGW